MSKNPCLWDGNRMERNGREQAWCCAMLLRFVMRGCGGTTSRSLSLWIVCRTEFENSCTVRTYKLYSQLRTSSFHLEMGASRILELVVYQVLDTVASSLYSTGMSWPFQPTRGTMGRWPRREGGRQPLRECYFK